MLGEAIVIARNGAGANISASADAGIADITEVVDLSTGGDLGRLGLDEITDPCALTKPRAGA